MLTLSKLAEMAARIPPRPFSGDLRLHERRNFNERNKTTNRRGRSVITNDSEKPEISYPLHFPWAQADRQKQVHVACELAFR